MGVQVSKFNFSLNRVDFGASQERKFLFPEGSEWMDDLIRIQSNAQPLKTFNFGANIGDVSERVHKSFKTAEIISFEPDPFVFADLEHRFNLGSGCCTALQSPHFRSS